MMKRIYSDFLKSQVSSLVRYAVINAICIGAFFLTGIFQKEKTRAAGIIVTIFLAGIMAWALVDVFIAARVKLSQQLSALSESERAEIISGYDSASVVGKRRFYKSGWLLLYSYRRVVILRCEEISAAEDKGAVIFLSVGGKSVLMPVEPNENSAVLLAMLKQFNPKIKILINGKPVGGA